MYDPIIRYISKYIALSQEDIRLFTSALRTRKIRKRQFLLQEGDISKYEYFVVRGCLKAYFTDAEGKEHILQFAVEDWWINDLQSFTSGEPAKLNIEALEETEVFQIEKEQLEDLYIKIPLLNNLFRQLFQSAFIALQSRVVDNLSKPAKERYLSFISKYRNIEQRVPQHTIASYLGITPEFLSQIRKKISQE